MGLIDAQTKAFWEDNTRFADLFNWYLFEGDPVIVPGQLHPADTTGLVLPCGPENKPEFLQRTRDGLRLVAAKEDSNAIYLMAGIEDQAKIDYGMPARLLGDDATTYSHQLRAFRRAYTKAQKEKLSAGAEFVSGMKKTDRLVPVVTLVVYFGEEPWDGAMSLHELLTPVSERILKYVPDYRMNLIQARYLSEEELDRLRSDLREIFGFLKYARDKAALMRFVEQNQPAFESMDWEAVNTLETLTGNQLLRGQKKGERVNMCQALVDLRQEGWDEGWNKGKNEGRNEGRNEGWNEGRNEGIIRGIVRMCKNFGLGFHETLAYAVKEASELPPQEVERQVKALW